VDTGSKTEKSAHMKKAILALAALLLACLGLAVTAAAASAHTPSISADCSGVHLTASSYEAGANTWTATVGRATQSGTFDTSFSQTFPVAQAGATTSWPARIVAYDGGYDSGDTTEFEGGPLAPTPSTPVTTPTPLTPQVPTVVDAGLARVVASEGPVASSDRSSVSVAAALAGAGFVPVLCAGFTRRRPSAQRVRHPHETMYS
jgi:hypothetical protein